MTKDDLKVSRCDGCGDEYEYCPPVFPCELPNGTIGIGVCYCGGTLHSVEKKDS